MLAHCMECKRCGFDSHNMHSISHFHHPHDHDPVQAVHYMIVEPTLCVCINVRSLPLYIIVSLIYLQFHGNECSTRSLHYPLRQGIVWWCMYGGDIREPRSCNDWHTGPECNSIPTLGTIIPIFITPATDV